MEINIVELIGAGIFGSFIGAGIAFFIFRFKKYKDKKNIIKNIEKQEDKTFVIPEVKEGSEEQNIVDLKVLAGLKEPEEDYEEDEEFEDDDEEMEEEHEEDYEEDEEFEDDDEEMEEEPDEDYNEYVSKTKDEKNS